MLETAVLFGSLIPSPELTEKKRLTVIVVVVVVSRRVKVKLPIVRPTLMA